MFVLARLAPPEFAVLFFVFAGLAFILQARRFGVSLLLAGAACILLPPLLAPFLPLVPAWLVVLLTAGFVLSVSRMLLNMSIGHGAADHVVGTFATDLIRFVLLLPFRLVGGLFAILFRRGAP